MLSYSQLDKADLSGLEHAADEWRGLKSAYEALGDQYAQRVTRRLKEHWKGEAADAAAAKLKATKSQMDAAAKEAHRMSQLLRDIHHDLRAHQKKLRAFETELTENHLTVDASGTVTDRHPVHKEPDAEKDPGYEDWKKKRDHLVDRSADRLRDILRVATEADAAADAALRADFNGEGDNTFNSKSYQTLDEAEKARHDADRAGKLMKDHSLTGTQLDELNTLLKNNSNDPVFASRFATSTGAEGTLKQYMILMNPPPGQSADTKLLKQVQKNLGTTLGTASRVDDPAVAKFRKDLVAAGNEDFNAAGGAPGPYKYSGYQLTSSLMAHGEWEKDMLVDHGEKLVTEENNRWDMFGGRESEWGGRGSDEGLISGDPFVGFTDGLGHNPEASTDFLSGTTKGTDDGDINNLDYLFKEREWPEGRGGKAHLGNALESATTGHAVGEAPPNPPPAHTRDQADIMEKVVKEVSRDPELAEGKIAGSFGRMSAEYMPDLNRAFGGSEASRDAVMPAHGPMASIDERDATRFLYSTSQEPDGYAGVVYGQAQYSSALMEYHLANPEAFEGTEKEVLGYVAKGSGTVNGIAGIARSDAVMTEQIENDQEFNDSLKTGGEWAKGIVSISTGFGGPVTAGAGEVANAGIDQVVKEVERDDTDDASYKGGGEYSKHKAATQENVQASAEQSAKSNGSQLAEDSRNVHVSNEVEGGYNSAERNVSRYINNRPDSTISIGEG